ncbi:MAG: type II toxin-antitoxin system HicB family antitoxin [Gemmatimonadota bacterium]|nr:type II toxin-antitoxin system HicB family antitoxin [Gemmatimonadota bacterium]
MDARNLTAVITREDDLYVADCPALGTVSQGTSPTEALENLMEATRLYLEETGGGNDVGVLT